jgi:O-glycosyl hydrolase
VPRHSIPAGNQSAVRVTSLKEAVPRRKVDVQNTMQSVRGFGIITRNGAIRRLPAYFQLFHSQKAATLAGVAAFGFLGPLESENVAR